LKRIPSTAPKEAPVATPSVSGVASGFENSAWKAAPATLKPAPASNASSMRGSRMLKMTLCTVSGTSSSGKNAGKSAAKNWRTLMWNLPIVTATIGSTMSAISMINKDILFMWLYF